MKRFISVDDEDGNTLTINTEYITEILYDPTNDVCSIYRDNKVDIVVVFPKYSEIKRLLT